MTSQEFITRARSQIGLKTVYELGRGGYHPKSDRAADVMGRCDCSGFLSWSLGSSRKSDLPWYREQNGGWIQTLAIERDAKAAGFGMFDRVVVPVPGLVIVWGGTPGHCGIVTEADNGSVVKVVHCSAGNYRKTGDAIQETDPEIFFANNAILARCAWVEA